MNTIEEKKNEKHSHLIYLTDIILKHTVKQKLHDERLDGSVACWQFYKLHS